jgi:diguanylate cyclase (GGDEF)-like protein
MSRAQLLTLALLTMHLVLGVLCLLVARGERPSAALRQWGWALIAFAAGAALTLIGALPLDLRQVLGNTLISASTAFSVAALLRHTSFHLHRNWYALGVALCAAALAYNHWQGFGLWVDIAIPTLFASLMFMFAITQLLRAPDGPKRPAVLFLVGVLVLTVLVWNARLAGIAQALGGSWDRDGADLIIGLYAIAQLVCLVAATLGLVWIEVRAMSHELERMALTDVLTGLPNRRAMLSRLADEKARADRAYGRFAVALFDADHFKQINDVHGHQAGDAALKQVALALARTKRGGDTLGRIGGEEFLVILPELDRARALEAAQRLRLAVADLAVAAAGKPLKLSLSGGVAIYPEDGDDWDHLYSAADRRLYRAKRAGRNRIVADDAG